MKGSTKLWIAVGISISTVLCIIYREEIVILVVNHWWHALSTIVISVVCLSTFFISLVVWIYLIYLGIKWINKWADKHLGI
jgi:hypothetical protein